VRRALPFAVVAGCLAVGVLPAFAADGFVSIRDFSFSPRNVAVLPGETVTWGASGTAYAHNVHFDGEIAPVGPPSMSFSGSKEFPGEGQFTYYCDNHDTMRGTVYVNSTGTVPATPTASPTASPTATPTRPPGGGGGTPGGGSPGGTTPGGTTAPVTSFRARATKSRFCTRRSARCKRPGVFLTLDIAASEAVRVRGTLRRGSRRVRTVTLTGRPGRHRVRLPGRALKPGRYALTLRAGALSRVVRFRVRNV
jgi:Copper binding proteins, plastocyanin/azurin family